MAVRVTERQARDEFAETVRRLVAESGHRQSYLAERSGLAHSTMTRILRGDVIPSESSTSALAETLGLDEASTSDLLLARDRAVAFPESSRSRRHNPRRNFVPRFGQPDPIRASGPADLQEALRAVHVWAGAPSLRKLEKASDGMLRRSTISDMLNGKDARLPEYDRYLTFLIVCGIDQASMDVWVYTWRRLLALEKGPEISSWMGGMSPASVR
ncbi:helix-turn-helix domain-containing protein [Streptomyces sp. NPDC058011]|uniref:helix-turn-helix domain-containing protein n=1 Tax=Streptomyces sp. NPDC058011 TaxID=3346305 RepID=UPI0036F0A34D